MLKESDCDDKEQSSYDQQAESGTEQGPRQPISNQGRVLAPPLGDHQVHRNPHHYDLGNEFYRPSLDQAEIQYTCAYYEKADEALSWLSWRSWSMSAANYD